MKIHAANQKLKGRKLSLPALVQFLLLNI